MVVATALQDRRIQPDPLPFTASVKEELGKFPKDWMRIADQDNPQGGPNRYYHLSGRPLKVSHRIGDPMLADVSLQNTTDFPIAIGPGGTIRPDLCFDAKVTLTDSQIFSRIAYEKVSNYLVLPAKTTSHQTVRLDQARWRRRCGRTPRRP